MERALKSTVVGGLLLPLLVVVGDWRVCTLTMANLLQEKLHPLVQLVAQVRQREREREGGEREGKVCVAVCFKVLG